MVFKNWVTGGNGRDLTKCKVFVSFWCDGIGYKTERDSTFDEADSEILKLNTELVRYLKSKNA